MGSIKRMVEEHVSGIYVKSLRIGNNFVEVSTTLSSTIIVDANKLGFYEQLLQECQQADHRGVYDD